MYRRFILTLEQPTRLRDTICYWPVISGFQSNSNVINSQNKSRSFLSFISFTVDSQHKVQVICTSSHLTISTLVQAAHTQFKLGTALPTALLLKAIPYVLSSVINIQHRKQKVSVHVWNEAVISLQVGVIFVRGRR